MSQPQDHASEIISTRIFSASRDRIFAAFSDPKQLAQWWGPKGFTNTFDQFDFRPGGDWKFTMHGPDGKDYANHTPSSKSCLPSASSMNMSPPISA